MTAPSLERPGARPHRVEIPRIKPDQDAAQHSLSAGGNFSAQITQSTGLAAAIDSASTTIVPASLAAITGGADPSLRLGCDPLHRHLLATESPGLIGWQPLSCWGQLLRDAGVIDAVLISVAGMAAEGAEAEVAFTQCRDAACGPWLDPARCGHAVATLPLGSRPLVLIYAPPPPFTSHRQPWQLLLPPADQQPLLWRQFQHLNLLQLRECSAVDCESWLQALLDGPHILPAHLSLLEEMPWREADLKVVLPPERLDESLWLLVREGEEKLPAIDALRKRLQARLRLDSPGMQPMD